VPLVARVVCVIVYSRQMFMRMCLDKKGAIRSGLWRNKTENVVLPRGVRKGPHEKTGSDTILPGHCVLHDGLLQGKICVSCG